MCARPPLPAQHPAARTPSRRARRAPLNLPACACLRVPSPCLARVCARAGRRAGRGEVPAGRRGVRGAQRPGPANPVRHGRDGGCGGGGQGGGGRRAAGNGPVLHVLWRRRRRRRRRGRAVEHAGARFSNGARRDFGGHVQRRLGVRAHQAARRLPRLQARGHGRAARALREVRPLPQRGAYRTPADGAGYDRAAAGGGALQGEVRRRGDDASGRRRAGHGRRTRARREGASALALLRPRSSACPPTRQPIRSLTPFACAPPAPARAPCDARSSSSSG